MRDLNEADLGGTFQARFERNAFDEALLKRLADLELGGSSLVFGRIDRSAESPDAVESFHIGRLAVADDEREPVVIDWRAPVAEPFYRATGRNPMGLVRRRHFAVEGPRLLGIEDELFGEGHLGLGHDEGLDSASTAPAPRVCAGTPRCSRRSNGAAPARSATSSPRSRVSRTRSSAHRSTACSSSREGPAPARPSSRCHRAAYLLYTHRFPLEDQGVLVIGPNRVFLRYIERVLPSLGEAGVEQVVLSDLVPGVQFLRPDDRAGADTPTAARLKGDVRMSDVIDQAIGDRERPLRDDLVIPFRTGYVRLRVEESARIVKAAPSAVPSPQQRPQVRRERGVVGARRQLPRSRDRPASVKDTLRGTPEIREALDRMWPLLTPAQLLHDLFGSKALLKLAARGVLDESEALALFRPRADSVDDVRWTAADVALLDDARDVLGPKPGRNGKIDDADEIRTYGHIVIDEVQDLTPMQLKMATRRSLNGAMTIVGDLAQATGPLAPTDWQDVLDHLPDRKPSRMIGLSVGYRIPGQIMELANRVMAVATPSLRSPVSVRVGDAQPVFVRADSTGALGQAVADQVRSLTETIPGGSLGVIAPDSMIDDLSEHLTAAGVNHGTATRTGLDEGVTLVPVSVVKGLELDAVVVVEPSRIVSDHEHGMRSLYVALTRPTQRLCIVHADELPEPLR